MQAKVENCFNKKAETEVSGDNFKGVTIMADIFQTENETYEIDVPKEKR